VFDDLRWDDVKDVKDSHTQNQRRMVSTEFVIYVMEGVKIEFRRC